MVLTVSFVLLCPGFLATVVARIISAKLDASVGASGPHDFAVRGSMPIVADIRPRPPPPAPNVVTMRNAPPEGFGMRLDIHLICISEKQKYFFCGGWTRDRKRV